MSRFFIDERIGCIAVRDRELTEPDYPGLHPDTCGVVKYWHGIQADGGVWALTAASIDEAHRLCELLNAGEVPYTPKAEDVEYIEERKASKP